MRQQGVEAVSLRRIAERLHVTPMAIYRHFRTKDALMSALLDDFIRNAKVLPEQDLPWDRWLRHVGLATRDAFIREPGWLLLMSGLRLQGGGLEVLDACMDVMCRAGFSTRDSLEAFFALVHLSFGAASLEVTIRRIDLGQPFDVVADSAMLSKLPPINEIVGAHHIERSLDLLVEALERRLT
jgi:TetR/AcrR family tetracycline transcriptional repressor